MKLRFPKRLYAKKSVIITSLVLFFPVGLVLMWKFAEWSKIAKWIVTTEIAFVTTIVLIGSFYSPPSITVKNIENNKITTDSAKYILAGNVTSMKTPTLKINDQSAPIASDNTFSYTISLVEGDNIVEIVAANSNGITEESITIHRTTESEFIARVAAENLAAEKRSREESIKAAELEAKKAQEASEKEKAKNEAKADEKAKKAANKKSRFSWWWPFNKSGVEKAKEKAEQNKLAEKKAIAARNAKQGIVDRFARLYCEKRRNTKVVLSETGKADGWPDNDNVGWTAEECGTIISRLYDNGATEKELELVVNGNYAIGMLEMSLLYSLGSPGRINRTQSYSYSRAQYVYGDPLRSAVYIYTVNGIVTTVQN